MIRELYLHLRKAASTPHEELVELVDLETDKNIGDEDGARVDLVNLGAVPKSQWLIRKSKKDEEDPPEDKNGDGEQDDPPEDDEPKVEDLVKQVLERQTALEARLDALESKTSGGGGKPASADGDKPAEGDGDADDPEEEDTDSGAAATVEELEQSLTEVSEILDSFGVYAEDGSVIEDAMGDLSEEQQSEVVSLTATQQQLAEELAELEAAA